MKKQLLVAILAGALSSGCTTTDTIGTERVLNQGTELKKMQYRVSKVTDIEDIRLKIHGTFGIAEGIFSTYLEKVKASPAYYQYVNATKGKSAEQIQQIRDDLQAQGQLGEIVIFEETNKALILETLTVAKTITQYADEFSEINTSDAFADLGFKDKLDEGLKVRETLKEVDYVKNATSQIIRLSAISAASQSLL